jgi:hypothetical protein
MALGPTVTLGFEENGNFVPVSPTNPLPISGGGGGGGPVNVLSLETGEPIPTDPVPTSGTIVVRTAPPPAPFEVVVGSLDTYSAQAGETGTSTAIPLEYPADAQVGDLLVAVVVTNSQTNTISVPAGWTTLQQQTPPTADIRTYGIYGYTVTGVVPTGTAEFSTNESNRVAAALFRITGANLADPVLANGGAGSRTTTTYTVPELVGSGGGLVISVTQGNSSSPNNPDPLAFSNGMEQLALVSSTDDLGVTRTWLNVAYMKTSSDLASFTVTSPMSVASMSSEVVAIGGAA